MLGTASCQLTAGPHIKSYGMCARRHFEYIFNFNQLMHLILHIFARFQFAFETIFIEQLFHLDSIFFSFAFFSSAPFAFAFTNHDEQLMFRNTEYFNSHRSALFLSLSLTIISILSIEIGGHCKNTVLTAFRNSGIFFCKLTAAQYILCH